MLIRAIALVWVGVITIPTSLRAQTADTQQLAAEIAFLEARVGRDEADPITPTRLGHAYLRQARQPGQFALYRRAEETFELALARAVDHFGALTGLAMARAARHRFGEALQLGERAIAINPDAPDGYAIAGDAALESGLFEKAATLYAAVARLAPGYYAETRLANLAAARNAPRAAYAGFERAHVDATRRMLPVDLRSWCRIRAAAVAFDHGDWGRAERYLAAAVRLSPESPAALEHLAELRAAQGRYHEALELYGKALDASPQPEFHEAIARIHTAQGRSGDAALAFRAARDGYQTAADSGDPGAFRHLALFYADVERDPARAIEWARQDLEIRQDAMTLGVWAWALLQHGDVEQAAAAAARAVAARPSDAMTWYRTGLVALASNDSHGARVRLTRALRINPRFAQSRDARNRLKAMKHW